MRFSLNKNPETESHPPPARKGPSVSTAAKSDLLLPLEYLRTGEQCEVIDVSGEPAWVARLAELGVRGGTRVRVVRGGSPCLIQVEGSQLSLRGDCSAQVLVRPLD